MTAVDHRLASVLEATVREMIKSKRSAHIMRYNTRHHRIIWNLLEALSVARHERED